MRPSIDQRMVNKLIALQFKAIGLPFTGPECLAGDWFHNHTWTPAQKERFKREFMNVVGKRYQSTQAREALWDWWDFTYGWSDTAETAD